MIGFLFEDEDLGPIKDLEKIVKLSLIHYKYTKNYQNEDVVSTDENNNIWTYEENSIDLAKCSSMYTPEQTGYTSIELDNFMCPKNLNITLGGTYSEDKLDYLGLSISLCKNSTESDIVCLPLKDQINIISNKYINLYINDFIVDPKNFEEPYKKIKRNLYMVADGKIFKEMEVYFNSIVITTDQGFLMEDFKVDQNYSFNYFTIDTATIDYNTIEDISIGKVWIYSNNKTIYI